MVLVLHLFGVLKLTVDLLLKCFVEFFGFEDVIGVIPLQNDKFAWCVIKIRALISVLVNIYDRNSSSIFEIYMGSWK